MSACAGAHRRRGASPGTTPRRCARVSRPQGLTRAAFRGVRRAHPPDQRQARARRGPRSPRLLPLQSTRFTPLPPIEPALSAKALVDRPRRRRSARRFSEGPPDRAPARSGPACGRVAALVGALDSPSRDPRGSRISGRSCTRRFPTAAAARPRCSASTCARCGSSIEKEFVAQPAGAAAVAELYRPAASAPTPPSRPGMSSTSDSASSSRSSPTGASGAC